ncbi:Methyltransferase domain-containing protein [Micromonospora phaseoli]|uniref:Methyltransferase domain-containing protein n=1 Tax=Micromonospora phaseoli TaxID=1144548 RepID=A0A1H6SQ46_9ACTN|nr:class I SAM-dependent methyltransferase [Micromonospora phaseoli]PZW03904.1 methyltransferase family protein [Micromonospora phaseoli]GIJ77681.1 hypothetical protein Xph01_21130 [Micromonospora phaseoli]SEI65712.1 Methyltransferase domain-containing protein [Micromonospora phaseoli]
MPQVITKIISKAVLQPRRTARILLDREGWSGWYWFLLHRSGRQPLDPQQSLVSRRYRSYDSYLTHQRSKLALLDLTSYEQVFRPALAERLAGEEWAGRSVLCLAARIGTEVKAFHDLGAFAVGIDLNPGPENRWVLPGDFHQLVFPAESVDAIYCNSFDHALDLKQTLSEIRRVLKRDGMLLVDAQQGASEVRFDEWAATSWSSINDLVDEIEGCGFALTGRQGIRIPWIGEYLSFRVVWGEGEECDDSEQQRAPYRQR